MNQSIVKRDRERREREEREERRYWLQSKESFSRLDRDKQKQKTDTQAIYN